MNGDDDDRWEVNQEVMRRLILSRFEDDVLLRGDVEIWLDALAVPGEDVVFEDGMLGQCYCSCEGCKDCGREAEDVVDAVEVEVELVPGRKFMAMLGLGGKGKKKLVGVRRRVAKTVDFAAGTAGGSRG